MDYDPSDSSGTDDDLPPAHQSRGMRGGRASGNGRNTLMGSLSFARLQTEMEAEIHQLEQEAYSSVLRAFKAQSDAITWEKESLITELRKELRVSDEEHRELLTRVNADDVIKKIREWRRSGGAQSVPDSLQSPAVSASRKKQRTAHPMPSSSLGAPSTALHPQAIAPSVQPSSSAVKRGSGSVSGRGKKSKSGKPVPVSSSAKPTPYPGQAGSRAEGSTFDPLIGRKVWTRWPEDNNFYEAVITDYNPTEGLHALVYDINSKDETWEWVNLKEMSADDIRWEGEEPSAGHRVGRSGPGRGAKKGAGRGSAMAGRGRGPLKPQPKKDLLPSQNGTGKKGPDDIELLDTGSLIKEVERVFGSAPPDQFEMEKAKKALKDHEQSLIEAIARLAEASDGESGEGEHRADQGQPMDWRYEGGGGEGSEGGGAAADEYRRVAEEQMI
ncbi:protein EMSY-LIKE 3-like [Wolffia australiana]